MKTPSIFAAPAPTSKPRQRKSVNTADSYSLFLDRKSQLDGDHGFDPLWMPEFLFGFQQSLVNWNLRKGRSATLADCGLGKTAMQLVWAENVMRKLNKPVLILCPLAVAAQTVREGEKFGVEVIKSSDGMLHGTKCLVANYQRLQYFSPDDFGGVVCDEAGILKNFDGAIRGAVTEFMRKIPYRLLATATAAPNDYVELGNHSEALGELGFMDMLGRFFKANNGSLHPMQHSRAMKGDKWRFRGHAEHDFWRWVCSWARALRRPSDLGFEDGKFILPKLITNQHIVMASTRAEGYLLDLPAHGLSEQRAERRRTIQERCEKAAQLATHDQPVIAWASLNDEADMLEEMIPGARQIEGHSMSDEEKEEIINAFVCGQVRALVAKPSMVGFGMNFQHCAHQTWFPSHSFEQFYQGSRRSWRFGQERDVVLDVITSEGEANVLNNLQRKASQAEEMFSKLVTLMNSELHIHKSNPFTTKQTAPSWLK